MENIVINLEQRTYPSLKNGAPLNRMPIPDDFEQVQFGSEYGGEIVVKYPNLGDRTKIDAVVKRELAKAGFTTGLMPNFVVQAQEYGFAVLEVLSVERPAWISRTELSTDLDQYAIGEIGRAFDEAVDAKKKKSTPTSTDGLQARASM